jgi:hypothetical protein
MGVGVKVRFARVGLAIVLFGGLAFFGPPSKMAAQTTMATLEGVVTDASRAVVPSVNVQLTNEGTNITATRKTDTAGRYYFPLLPPASYRLKVAVQGFSTFEQSGIVLQVQQAARVDVVLSPGELSTTVEVSGEAPRLDAVNATQGNVITNAEMLNMPIGSLNPLSLAVLTPGVVGVGGYPTGGGVNFSANGGRLSITDVLLDGVTTSVMEHNSGIQDIQFTPTTEGVQEFKIQTNNYSAEYGTSGAVVISMVSKSGTNAFHGDGFEYYSNNDFDANNFFSNANGQPLTAYHASQYGGTVGGPIILPKIYNGRNKTFFFEHYERQANPTSKNTETDTVPTALEKNGDFSQTFDSSGNPVEIFDPSTVQQDSNGNWTRAPYAGNVIPKGTWSPVAAKVIPFYPDPTSAGIGPSHQSNYFKLYDHSSNWYEQESRVDHNFTDNHRLSVRYSRIQSNNLDDQDAWGAGNYMIPQGYNENPDTQQNAVANYTYILGPTAVLSLQWGLTRQLFAYDRIGASSSFDPASLGFNGVLDIQRPPYFQLEGYTYVGPDIFGRQEKAADVNHIQGSLTKVKGMHSIKFGAEGRFSRLNYAQPGIATAAFTFCNQQTASTPFTSSTAQGNALASFMTGFGGSCSTPAGSGQNIDATSLGAARTYGGYFQDDIRLTPKLTANLGLRYELQRAGTERHNRLQHIDLNMASPIASDVAGAADCPACANLKGGIVYQDSDNRQEFNTQWHDFAPRVGFAYNFAPHMVFRGGYGIFYGLSNGSMTGFLADGYTTSTSFINSTDGGIHEYASVTNPFPNGIRQPSGASLGASDGLGDGIGGVGMVTGGTMGGLDVNTTPQIQQWGASIERELPGNSVVELAYSAAKGTHLPFGTMVRQPDLLDPSYFSLGSKLFDQVSNPFYGLVPASAALNTPTVSRRQLLLPYPQYSLVQSRPGPPRGNSNYQSMILKYTKRLSRGLQVTASYTFSKSISDSDSSDDPDLDWLTGAVGENSSGRARVQDSGNLRLERSVSQFDIPQKFVTNFSYKLPIGRGQTIGRNWNRVADIIAGGWQLNGILTMESGTPLVPHLAGGSGPNVGYGMVQRPNILSDPCTSGSVESRLTSYLNPAAFSVPAAFTDGTAPRVMGYCRAPGYHGLDASMFKQFHLNEAGTRYFEFRGEAFSVTNTPIFGVPGTTFGSGGFGVISNQVGGQRGIRLVGKFYF